MNSGLRDIVFELSPMLTAEDVSSILKISKAKAYALMRSPEFPAVKIGNSVRVSVNNFQKWIQENTRNS